VRRVILASLLGPPTDGIRRTKGEIKAAGGEGGSDRTREEVTRRGRARSGRENVCETPGNSAARETTRGCAGEKEREREREREKGEGEGRGEKEKTTINVDVFLRPLGRLAMFVLGNAITLSYKI